MYPLSKWHVIWLTGAALVIVAASLALQARRSVAPAGPIQITESPPVPVAATVSLPSPTARGGPIYVHVTGQIARPGLYRVHSGARVMDAITGAGGATEFSNLDALNLATPLHDGQKLVVPRLGEPAPASGSGYLLDSPPPPAATLVRADPAWQEPPPDAAYPFTQPVTDYADPMPRAGVPGWAGQAGPLARTSAASTDKLRVPGDGVVNINSAGFNELQRLPGVGPSTAQKIVDYRGSHGGFRTVEELMEIKGIGEKKLAKMAPFVRL